jgi:uncharacterized protein involved in exopolysaccharide biosynthesis
MQRHTLLALAVFIITSLIGFLYLHVRYATNYLGQAIVYVSPAYPKTLNADPETDHTGDYGTFIDEQVHSVNRIDIMVDAIRRMPPGIWRHAGETEQSAAQRLAGALEVQRVAETYQISIGLHGGSPTHLAEIVNAVANAYVAASHNEEFYGRDARLKGLQDERDRLQTDLTARLAEQTALLKDLGLGSIDANTVNPYNARIEKLNTDLLAAREARQVAESQLSSFHDSDQGTSTAIHSEAQELAQADQGLIAFKETLNERRAKLVSDIAGMKPDNPVYKTDQEELGEIDTALRKTTQDMTAEAQSRLEQRYRGQLDRARSYEQDLENQIAEETVASTEAIPKFQAAEEMTTDIARMNGRMNELRDRMANLEIEDSSPGSVHLFSPAVTPMGPDSSKAQSLLLVLFPFCFCLAIAVAVARDTFDMRVFTPEGIERTLGLPPIGILFNRDEVTDEVSSEYLFRIAASLDHAHRTAGVKSIAVTSVKPRGGTSTIVDLVAAELAQLGNRVLVLDAGGTREPIAFVPPDQDSATSNTRARTLHPELGPYLHSRGRLLPSVHAVTRTFHEIHGDYDILLLDCQPLFVSADTEYLARTSDATLLIVESGMVLKQDLMRAARLLERLPVPSIAVMLNQLKLARAGADLREDLREFVTFGRGFAHGKPIPLTTTRHADYPVSTPGSYQAQEEPAYVPPATEPPPAPFVPSSDYMPPARESHTYEPPPEHESGEHLEDDRSDSRNDGEDET